MMRRASFALLSHVAQCLWCLHGMIVHLAGPKSIMGTWWLNTTTTRSSLTSFVLTKMQSSQGSKNGALLYLVEGVCGTLPCLPYVNGRELTCAVCTKWRHWGIVKGSKGKIVQNRNLIDWFLDDVDSRDFNWRKTKRKCRHLRRVNVIHIAKLKTCMDVVGADENKIKQLVTQQFFYLFFFASDLITSD